MTMMAALQYVSYNDRNSITDMFIPLKRGEANNGGEGGFVVDEDLFGTAYAFTGDAEARGLFNGRDSELMQWLIALYLKSEAHLTTKDDFRIEHDEALFRAKRIGTAHGTVLALRRIPTEVPKLTELRLPFGWHMLLLDPDLLKGGLLLFTATNGQGKTTTASAVLRARLEKYAGHANAVEDPPELPLGNKWFGKATCNQIPVEDLPGQPLGSGYQEALRNALRGFPSIKGGGSTVLFVGEIRDNAVAEETLLAAANGHLVLATFHGGSIAHALQRITSMAGTNMGTENARGQLASVLKMCTNQTLFLRDHPAGDNPWEQCDVRGDILFLERPQGQLYNDIQAGDWSSVAKRSANQTRALAAMSGGAAGAATPDAIKRKLADALSQNA